MGFRELEATKAEFIRRSLRSTAARSLLRAAALLAVVLADFEADFFRVDCELVAAEGFEAADFFECAVLCPAEKTARKDTKTGIRTKLLILTVNYSLTRKVAAEQNRIVIGQSIYKRLVEIIRTCG